MTPPGASWRRNHQITKLKAGGKPSTRLPPGKLVEHSSSPNPFSSSLEPPNPASSQKPRASSHQPPPSGLQPQPAAMSHLETPQKHRTRPDLTGNCLKQKVVPGLFQSSQATVLELWASPDLLGPPGTQLDTSWSHLEMPQKHRKRPRLTGKCLKQEVVIQASPRGLRPPFWSCGLPLTS